MEIILGLFLGVILLLASPFLASLVAIPMALLARYFEWANRKMGRDG